MSLRTANARESRAKWRAVFFTAGRADTTQLLPRSTRSAAASTADPIRNPVSTRNTSESIIPAILVEGRRWLRPEKRPILCRMGEKNHAGHARPGLRLPALKARRRARQAGSASHGYRSLSKGIRRRDRPPAPALLPPSAGVGWLEVPVTDPGARTPVRVCALSARSRALCPGRR